MTRKQIFIAVAIVTCGIAFFVLVKFFRASGAGGTSGEEALPTVVTVQTGKLQRATLHGYVEGFGMVGPAPAEEGQPPASARVASPVAGVLAAVKIGEGEQVKKGEVLFQLESAVADVAVEFARKTLERQKALLQMNNTSQKAVQDAEQQLASAEAQQALLRIAAPFSGKVVRINVRPGEAVDLTTPLADIVDLSRLVISAQIPAADAGRLHPGDRVEVPRNPPVTTALSFVSPEVDASNATVLVRAPAPEGSGLRLGEFVHLRIVAVEHTNCLAAPVESVVSGPEGTNVIAVVSNNEAVQVPVATGLREDGLIEIEGQGLQAGQTVVTLGAYGLPKKTRIRVGGL